MKKKKTKLAFEELKRELNVIRPSNLLFINGGNSSGDFPIELFSQYFQQALSMSSSEVYQHIGGMVEYNHDSNPASFSNACALRISLALNMIGGEYSLSKGSGRGSGDYNDDGSKEWYFYKALDAEKYLNQYGSSTKISSMGDIPSGAQGFIIFENFDTENGTFNHIDFVGESGVMGSDYSSNVASSGNKSSMRFIRLN